ncbi:hypothetical protein SAY87_025366 [Trapa incisa]|uniref:Uncharacterized protein n=1 Tax=Trapa incisa TaxID=236973 RepID=A0AAN7GDI8_9MYRT|nr:hypothetical protein SAY87_025366 [Trapa incisa]
MRMNTGEGALCMSDSLLGLYIFAGHALPFLFRFRNILNPVMLSSLCFPQTTTGFFHVSCNTFKIRVRFEIVYLY